MGTISFSSPALQRNYGGLLRSGRDLVFYEMRERSVSLAPGEVFVVPKGIEHRPVAKEEVHLLLIEPSGTPNTGDPATAAARRVI